MESNTVEAVDPEAAPLREVDIEELSSHELWLVLDGVVYDFRR